MAPAWQLPCSLLAFQVMFHPIHLCPNWSKVSVRFLSVSQNESKSQQKSSRKRWTCVKKPTILHRTIPLAILPSSVLALTTWPKSIKNIIAPILKPSLSSQTVSPISFGFNQSAQAKNVSWLIRNPSKIKLNSKYYIPNCSLFLYNYYDFDNSNNILYWNLSKATLPAKWFVVSTLRSVLGPVDWFACQLFLLTSWKALKWTHFPVQFTSNLHKSAGFVLFIVEFGHLNPMIFALVKWYGYRVMDRQTLSHIGSLFGGLWLNKHCSKFIIIQFLMEMVDQISLCVSVVTLVPKQTRHVSGKALNLSIVDLLVLAGLETNMVQTGWLPLRVPLGLVRLIPLFASEQLVLESWLSQVVDNWHIQFTFWVLQNALFTEEFKILTITEPVRSDGSFHKAFKNKFGSGTRFGVQTRRTLHFTLGCSAVWFWLKYTRRTVSQSIEYTGWAILWQWVGYYTAVIIVVTFERTHWHLQGSRRHRSSTWYALIVLQYSSFVPLVGLDRFFVSPWFAKQTFHDRMDVNKTSKWSE